MRDAVLFLMECHETVNRTMLFPIELGIMATGHCTTEIRTLAKVALFPDRTLSDRQPRQGSDHVTHGSSRQGAGSLFSLPVVREHTQ